MVCGRVDGLVGWIGREKMREGEGGSGSLEIELIVIGLMKRLGYLYILDGWNVHSRNDCPEY